jgi:hypothetical protein
MSGFVLGCYSQNTVQIDNVLAYPQAVAKQELLMEIPHGCELNGSNPKRIMSYETTPQRLRA